MDVMDVVRDQAEVYEMAKRRFADSALKDISGCRDVTEEVYRHRICKLEEAEAESWARCRELDRQATEAAKMHKLRRGSKKQADRARKRSVEAQRVHHRLLDRIFRLHRGRLARVVRDES